MQKTLQHSRAIQKTLQHSRAIQKTLQHSRYRRPSNTRVLYRMHACRPPYIRSYSSTNLHNIRIMHIRILYLPFLSISKRSYTKLPIPSTILPLLYPAHAHGLCLHSQSIIILVLHSHPHSFTPLWPHCQCAALHCILEAVS